MSVAPSLSDLPDHRIPKRLNAYGIPRARGPNSMRIWRMGDGPFLNSPIVADLNLRLDPRDPLHGLVEPATIVKLDQYRRAIEQTRELWVIDEVV